FPFVWPAKEAGEKTINVRPRESARSDFSGRRRSAREDIVPPLRADALNEPGCSGPCHPADRAVLEFPDVHASREVILGSLVRSGREVVGYFIIKVVRFVCSDGDVGDREFPPRLLVLDESPV